MLGLLGRAKGKTTREKVAKLPFQRHNLKRPSNSFEQEATLDCDMDRKRLKECYGHTQPQNYSNLQNQKYMSSQDLVSLQMSW
jgi:hypothetical protein